MKDKKGFTLVELLAVIVILAVIAFITTPIIWNSIEASKEASYNHQLLEIYKAAELYFTESSVVVENGQTMYVSVGELVTSGYLDPFPKDYVKGGYMGGVVEIQVKYPNNQYNYLTPEEVKERASIVSVSENQTVKSILVSGKTTPKDRNLLKELANIVVEESNNSEFMKLGSYDSFVADSNDISSVKEEWFQEMFLPNTVYTFSIESIALSPNTGNEIYHPKMKFLYTDGTSSEEYPIGSHLNHNFKRYTYGSDEGKSVRAIAFITDAESPYRFGYNLETFSITPKTVASLKFPQSLTSLGESGFLILKMIDQENQIKEQRISLLSPLYGIEETSVNDEILLNTSGEVQIKRNVGKMILDGYNISSSDVKIVSHSESTNGYHTFEIQNVFPNKKNGSTAIMSNYFPQLSNCWNASVNQVGISVSSSQNNVYLKVLKSEFPDVASIITWLKQYPIDLYYELASTEIETLPNITFENKNLRYIYVDGNVSAPIKVEYE